MRVRGNVNDEAMLARFLPGYGLGGGRCWGEFFGETGRGLLQDADERAKKKTRNMPCLFAEEPGLEPGIA